MMDSCIRITLDLRQIGVSTIVRAKRSDTGRVLRIALADDGVPYTIEPDCYAVFTAKKPDRTVLYNRCVIESNEVVYAFTEQTTAVTGRMPAEIRLYGADEKLITSARFYLEVLDTVYHAEDILSQDEMDAVDALILETTAIKNEVEQKLANGEFDGRDGEDGISPTVAVVPVSGGYRVTITDKNGTNTVDLVNGKDGYTPVKGKDYFDGRDGEDGVSPTVAVVPVSGGYRVTITDKNGTNTVDLVNGKDGYTPVKGKDYVDGRTPARGTDYWTAADIAEIKSYVDEAILGGAW